MNRSAFNILAANFGQMDRTWQSDDFNRDGLANLNDFNVLAANFGVTAAGPIVTPVTRRGSPRPCPSRARLACS